MKIGQFPSAGKIGRLSVKFRFSVKYMVRQSEYVEQSNYICPVLCYTFSKIHKNKLVTIMTIAAIWQI